MTEEDAPKSPILERNRRTDEDRYQRLLEGGLTPAQVGRLRENDKLEYLAVLQLGGQMGFGRIMQLAERIWSEMCEVDGHPGGEHTVGPCAGLMVLCACVEEDGPVNCDWCCGAGRVTKKVRELQRSSIRLHVLEAGEEGLGHMVKLVGDQAEVGRFAKFLYEDVDIMVNPVSKPEEESSS